MGHQVNGNALDPQNDLALSSHDRNLVLHHGNEAAVLLLRVIPRVSRPTSQCHDGYHPLLHKLIPLHCGSCLITPPSSLS